MLLHERIVQLWESNDLPLDQRELEFAALQAQWESAARTIYADLKPWETVLVARHPNRPLVGDYIHYAVQEFCELYGDRNYGDDAAFQEFVVRQIDELKSYAPDDLLSRRYHRLRSLGCFYEQIFTPTP